MHNLEIIPVEHLSAITGGQGPAPAPSPAPSGGGGLGNVLENVKVNLTGDVNRLVESVGAGAQRLIGCGFGANSRQEFGRCVLNGQLDPQPQPAK